MKRKSRLPRPGDPHLEVPDTLGSDFGPGDAAYAYLVPTEVACERVVFGAEQGDTDLPRGYQIPLDDLRDRPGHWIDHLARKRTREGYRPAIEMLDEELQKRAADD